MGILANCSESILPPVSARSVCSKGAAVPLTSTVCVTAPGVSSKFTRAVVLGGSSTPERTVLLKPCFSASTR